MSLPQIPAPNGRPGDFLNPRAAAGAKLGKLHEIQGVMQSLRSPLETPDLTDAILSRVGAERPFTDPTERRWVWAGRASVAAGILMLLGAVFLLHAMAPNSTTWANRAAPLSSVIDNCEAEVGESYVNIRARIASVNTIVPTVEVPAVCQAGGGASGVGGCWASPLLTTPSAGLSEATAASSGQAFGRYKAEYLQDRYLAATVLQSKPVAPPAPH